MNMINTMRRGLATTAMSLVCLMAGTMNTLAATDAGTELVSQIDAAAGGRNKRHFHRSSPDTIWSGFRSGADSKEYKRCCGRSG